ncbi:epitope biosynthesis protein [Tamilnaduibacter salinus]|uniref:Epitope biosynthesis protein n=1 Tax=Tamilnaduibacter salinus TaxID=1484056 RepID=A0A2A2I3J2_9GAMM|nr:glycosyltransferase family 25 protein [Tamilnaduibacter salinus]PAV25876.1 epitope biosynthesis protein [Tamilnaduibacter salinus]
METPETSPETIELTHQIKNCDGRLLVGETDPITMEIVVISLRRATDRRHAIQRQFDELGLAFSFLDAVDGKQPHPLFSRFNARKAWWIGEIPLTDGHLGCYASHYLAWQKCVDDGEPKIILEDDALLYRDSFLAFMEMIPKLPDRFECIRLFQNKSRKSANIPVYSDDTLTISKFLRGHKSATGYYVTPAAAHKFLSHAQSWTEPLDLEMDQFWANKVECYGTLPPCLTNDGEFDSAIDKGMDTAELRQGFMRWRWRIYNMLLRLPRSIHNLMFRLKTSRTPQA